MSPLIKGKSKQAFSKNVATEMDAGKPQKQSLAIAYSVKRKAPKKMANGGQVHEAQASTPEPLMEDSMEHSAESKKLSSMKMSEHPKSAGSSIDPSMSKPLTHEPSTAISTHEAHSIAEAIMHANRMKMQFEDQNDTMSSPVRPGYADGGEVEPEVEPEDDQSLSDILTLPDKVKSQYADGGMVDIDTNAEEQPNGYYERNEDDTLDEDMDSTMDGMKQPKDSNEHSEELEDEDSHDMVSEIMKKNKKSKK